MIKNRDFLVSLDTNPYYFCHFDLCHFTLFYNGKPIPREGLALYMFHAKNLVMAYNNLFEESGILHSNAGLQLIHDMFRAVYYMLLVDLIPNLAASEVRISLTNQGNIRLEL